ncbi:MAG: PEP-utilizing enzyme [Candidatus Diapherotrites archaeon]
MNETAEKQIREFSKACPLFNKEIIVIEKNENSELIEKIKPCNREFFRRLFNGVFWNAYSATGVASVPFNSEYMALIGNEMFFCRNTEQRFLRNIGVEKKFRYLGGKIAEYTSLGFENLIFLLAMPLELMRNAERISIAALKVNSDLVKFEGHYTKSISFWKENRSIKDPLEISSLALDGALESMRYSLISSLASSLKIRLRDSFSTKNNFLGEIISSSARNETEIKNKYGYFSLSPYDISKPFLDEDPSVIPLLKNIPQPKEPHYIWRENAKLCCSMYLSVLRKCFLSLGNGSGMGESIFFLNPSELPLVKPDSKKAKQICLKRKKEFEKSCEFTLPRRIAIQNEKPLFEQEEKQAEISGLVAGSKQSATGKIVFVESSSDFSKVSKGDIIFSRNFSPELVVFYSKCSAVLSETGGMLAHSAIVAREQNIPCIVQLKAADLLKEGMKVMVDGGNGKVTILN